MKERSNIFGFGASLSKADFTDELAEPGGDGQRVLGARLLCALRMRLWQ
jgi:hypothetical protein